MFLSVASEVTSLLIPPSRNYVVSMLLVACPFMCILRVHAVYPCMSLPNSLLHVRAAPSVCMMSMLHFYAAYPCCMTMLNVHATLPFISMLLVHAYQCCIFLMHSLMRFHAASACSMNIQYGHAARTCSVDMRHRNCGIDMKNEHAAFMCSMDM